MAYLDHMFDGYHMCDRKWCYKNHIEEHKAISMDEKAEKMSVG